MTSIRPLRALATALSAVALLGVLLAAPAAADTPATDANAADIDAVDGPVASARAFPAPQSRSARSYSFSGRGWGHGRGMSQYGAQGYATEFGWSSSRILDHYYGAASGVTRAGTVDEAASLPVDLDAVRIRLIGQDALSTTIQIADGSLAFSCGGTPDCLAALRGDDPAPIRAVRLTRVTSGDHDANPDTPDAAVSEQLQVEVAASCAGPFQRLGHGLSGKRSITVSRASGADQLALCRAGITRWYPDTLTALIDDGVQRTINTTSMEQQLRGIVPHESPPSWSAAALQAQAVAARSYALAGDTRHQPYADTCDTILCQVYKGHAEDTGSGRTSTTWASTDAAIAATAGVVRLHGSGAIARTEFSSTSGGWTAGGTFPAVQDEGDRISPLHTWTRSYDITPLEERYGDGELLVQIEVLSRNGLGADGGRVRDTRLHFLDGSTVQVPGNTVRSRIGMLSDWFTPPPRDTAIDPTGICEEQAPYLDAVHQLFIERNASGAERDQWCDHVTTDTGRLGLTDALAVSDEWAGVKIAGLYTDILGRTADAQGRAYWLELVADGLRVEEIAAQFYGSKEFFVGVGQRNDAFVDAIYAGILGRAPAPNWRAHWIGELDRGLRRELLAAELYLTEESRGQRVDALYDTILDRTPDPSGRAYWIGQLRTIGQVRLAVFLAGSDEYYDSTF